MTDSVIVPIRFSSPQISEETKRKARALMQKDLMDWRARVETLEAIAEERNAIRRVVCKAIINNPSKAAHKALLEVIDGINDLAGYETQATKRRRGKRGVAIR